MRKQIKKQKVNRRLSNRIKRIKIIMMMMMDGLQCLNQNQKRNNNQMMIQIRNKDGLLLRILIERWLRDQHSYQQMKLNNNNNNRQKALEFH